jgi:hypothetical protein
MADAQKSEAAVTAEKPGYTYQKREYTRWWEVLDPSGELVCLTVYRRGGAGGGAAAKRLTGIDGLTDDCKGSRRREALWLL